MPDTRLPALRSKKFQHMPWGGSSEGSQRLAQPPQLGFASRYLWLVQWPLSDGNVAATVPWAPSWCDVLCRRAERFGHVQPLALGEANRAAVVLSHFHCKGTGSHWMSPPPAPSAWQRRELNYERCEWCLSAIALGKPRHVPLQWRWVGHNVWGHAW